jgi:hypothetical protein
VTTTAQGYGVEATLTDEALRLRATTKMGRTALFGPDPRDVVDVPLEQIASATHKPPKIAGFINGLLDVRTTDGIRYQVHYRVKKNRDFGALADDVVAAVTPAPSA